MATTNLDLAGDPVRGLRNGLLASGLLWALIALVAVALRGCP